VNTDLDHNQQIQIGYRTRGERILQATTDCDSGIKKEEEEDKEFAEEL